MAVEQIICRTPPLPASGDNSVRLEDWGFHKNARTALNVSWREHPINQRLYGNIPKLTSLIREQCTRRAGHSYRSNQELASDLILWQPTRGHRGRGRPSKTYINQLVADTGFPSEHLATNEKSSKLERKSQRDSGNSPAPVGRKVAHMKNSFLKHEVNFVLRYVKKMYFCYVMFMFILYCCFYVYVRYGTFY